MTSYIVGTWVRKNLRSVLPRPWGGPFEPVSPLDMIGPFEPAGSFDMAGPFELIA